MTLEYTVFPIAKGSTLFEQDCYQYWLVMSGQGRILAEDFVSELTEHDVLEIPTGIPYKIESESGLQIGCVLVHNLITNNRVFHLKSYAGNEVIRKVFFFALDFQGIHHKEKKTMMSTVDHLMYEALWSTGLDNYEINPQIAGVIDEFNQHYREADYDINPAISRSGYSQSHFRKLFKEYTGMTPVGFIHHRRVDDAKNLLKQSEQHSISDVAAQVGFTDVYYFSRIFRKECGISPSGYRENYRNSLEIHG